MKFIISGMLTVRFILRLSCARPATTRHFKSLHKSAALRFRAASVSSFPVLQSKFASSIATRNLDLLLGRNPFRNYSKMSENGDGKLLLPPESVRGMTSFDCEAFKKTVSVPAAKVTVKHIQSVLDVLKKHYLKLFKFNAIREYPKDALYKKVYLNPLSFKENKSSIDSDLQSLCSKLQCTEVSDLVQFFEDTIELTYENWSSDDILRAVLPLDYDVASGYSFIGHIVHLNLRDHLLPYKKLIGKVLLDKTRGKLIVNKVDTIDSSDDSFRSFSMEVLAGEGGTIATVKESKCVFELDFAKVYWNSRLETEHNMVIKKMRREGVLYDVMAGIGPFSIPAAKNVLCNVLANDLNPESYRWLVHNCKINKVSDSVTCYNLDGAEFIKTAVKDDLARRWTDPHFSEDLHITMNLPGLAVEFLPNFVGLLSDLEESEIVSPVEPTVHVYMFSRDMKASSCVTKVAYHLGLVDELPDFDGEVAAALKKSFEASKKNGAESGLPLERPKFVNDAIEVAGLDVKDVRYVRKVSRNKIMVRVSFQLSKEVLTRKCSLKRTENNNEASIPLKKRKVGC